MGEMGENGNNPEQQSKLIVTFGAPGSAEFSITFENVNSAQLFAVSAYLDWHARRMLDWEYMVRALEGDSFSVRWTGTLVPPASGSPT